MRWSTRALVHRYYDPATGQFISVDPAVDATDAPYSYAADDPVILTDPYGLDSVGSWVENHVVEPTVNIVGATGRCLSNTGKCLNLHGVENAGTAVYNSLVGVTDPAATSAMLPIPYPCSPDSYGFGQGLFFGAAFFVPGADEADGLEFASGEGLDEPLLAAAPRPSLNDLVGGEQIGKLVQRVLRGKASLSDLTIEQRAAAAQYYREVATRTVNRNAAVASRYNIARAEYLEGTRSTIAPTLPEFEEGGG